MVGSVGGIVLVVEDDATTRALTVASLQREGFDVIAVADGIEALASIAENSPDLVVADVAMPNLEGLELLRILRSDPKTNALPFIFVTARNGSDDVLRAFRGGADDYLVKPIRYSELAARVRAMLMRPPVPVEGLLHDRRSGLLSERAFVAASATDLERAEREYLPMSFAYIDVFESSEIHERFGEPGEGRIAGELATLVRERFETIARLGRDEQGRFMVLLRSSGGLARGHLDEISRTIAAHRFRIGFENIRLTPIVGFATRVGTRSFEEMRRRAFVAFTVAAWQLDFGAVRYRAALEGPSEAKVVRGGDFPDLRQAAGIVLVVDHDPATREAVVASLAREGVDVLSASDGIEALARIAEFPPDLIVADVSMPNLGGIDLLRRVRAEPKTHTIPFVLLTARRDENESTLAFEAGADDYLVKPVLSTELVARVRTKLLRPPVPLEVLKRDRRSGLPEESAYVSECERDFELAERECLPLSFAYLDLFEWDEIAKKFGEPGQAVVAREIALLLTKRFGPIARVGRDGENRFMLLIQTSGLRARYFLNEVSRTIVARTFHIGTEDIRLTPLVAYATNGGTESFQEMRRRASAALGTAASHLDLQAVCYNARSERTIEAVKSVPLLSRLRAGLRPMRVPAQVTSMIVGGLVIPFAGYCFLGAHGLDVSDSVYVLCVLMLILMAVSIWLESLLAVAPTDPAIAAEYPTASAVIAAYLPNEAATIVETVESFLNVTYARDLQVILAYNTPHSLPIEDELRAIAARDPRFVPLRVDASSSKAQNVNTALGIVRGAFVGIFDADHKPDPDSFTRAWNWLAGGYDVVQGHCVIRNGDASLIAQLVAVEFEAIYAVSHPGRARMHGFGVFGGSNGYWKTDLLRQTRMHGFMMTEDIDASLRVVQAGYRIAVDRNLISRELAPVTWGAFWNQRLRWAQGWFQASLKHLIPALTSRHLTPLQKFGILHLLLWRELSVWIIPQILPILAYWVFVRHDHINWFVPIFLATTIFVALTGPFQLAVAFLLADGEIKRRHRWFLNALICSFTFFTEFKNVISRIAQLKEAMRERHWKVTPRAASVRK